MKTSEMINKINEVAQSDYEYAAGMLEMFNMIYGTRYSFFKRRVIRFDDPDAPTCERYTHFHDVYTEINRRD